MVFLQQQQKLEMVRYPSGKSWCVWTDEELHILCALFCAKVNWRTLVALSAEFSTTMIARGIPCSRTTKQIVRRLGRMSIQEKQSLAAKYRPPRAPALAGLPMHDGLQLVPLGATLQWKRNW